MDTWKTSGYIDNSFFQKLKHVAAKFEDKSDLEPVIEEDFIQQLWKNKKGELTCEVDVKTEWIINQS